MHQLITPEQVRKHLDFEGKSIADFAREHDLYASTVYQVISGPRRGPARRRTLEHQGRQFSTSHPTTYGKRPTITTRSFPVYQIPKRIRNTRVSINLAGTLKPENPNLS